MVSYREDPWDETAFDGAQLSLRGGLGLELIQRGQNLSKVSWSDAQDQQVIRHVQSSLRRFLEIVRLFPSTFHARPPEKLAKLWRAALGVSQSIDSISDEYGDLKAALMQAFCGALELYDKECLEVWRETGPFLEVLTRKPEYLQESPKLPELASQFPLDSWITRLTSIGINGCTRILYADMSERLRARLSEFYRQVIPPTWR
jgi:hypothetical protein